MVAVSVSKAAVVFSETALSVPRVSVTLVTCSSMRGNAVLLPS